MRRSGAGNGGGLWRRVADVTWPTRTSTLVVALALLGCPPSSPAPRLVPTAPLTAHAPEPTPAASLSSPPPAMSSGPVAVPRPAPRMPWARELESILREVCPVEYVLGDGHVGVGCSNCLGDEPFARDEFSVASDVPQWAGGAPVRGSFTGPGADDAFVIFRGACNPKHSGYALFHRAAGRWTVASSSPARDLDECLAVKVAQSQDVVLCRAAILGLSSDVDLLVTISPGHEEELLVLPHWGRYLPRPPTRLASDFSIGRMVPERGAVKVEVLERRAPSHQVTEETHRWADVPVAATHTLSFVVVGGRLAPAPRTSTLLAAWKKLLPNSS